MIAIEGRNLSLLRGKRKVLDNLSISLKQGQLTGIIGCNGAGKSSLLSLLSGYQQTQTGEVLYAGKSITNVTLAQRAKQVAFLPQGQGVHWPLPVERVVALGRLPHGSDSQLSDADCLAIRQAMRWTNITHLAGRNVQTLSGGERGRVLLARALAIEASVLLADEPLAGLDPGCQLRLMELLQKLAMDGMAIALVLHDLDLATRYCDALYLLHEGRLLASGSPDEVLTGHNLGEAFGIKAWHGVIDNHRCMVPLTAIANSPQIPGNH